MKCFISFVVSRKSILQWDFIGSDVELAPVVHRVDSTAQQDQVLVMLVQWTESALSLDTVVQCNHRTTRAGGLFLKSPETFRAYFGYHNSLYIFATPTRRF